MLARFHSVALVGIDAVPCEVEVDVAGRGMKDPVIVGLPDTAVKESLERIHSALENCGYEAPSRRVTVNLAPANLRKEGPAFDLPIALGVIFANGLGTTERAGEYLVAGELALDGRVRPIRGALSMALLARERKFAGLLVPRGNAEEAAVVEDVDVIPVTSLSEAVGFFTEQLPLEPVRVDLESLFEKSSVYDIDFSDVRGQEAVKRALAIAAAGAHNILLIGPPGSGKTVLSRRMPTPCRGRRLRQGPETIHQCVTPIFSSRNDRVVSRAIFICSGRVNVASAASSFRGGSGS